jgi:hypothetical protein
MSKDRALRAIAEKQIQKSAKVAPGSVSMRGVCRIRELAINHILWSKTSLIIGNII